MAAPKILVIDDDIRVLEMLRERLERWGYEVCVAEEGEKALAKAKEEKPALIITDVLMPKKTGYEMVREMRGDPALKDIPIIVISGRPEMKDFFADFYGIEFVPKPFDTNDLLARIQRLVGVAEKPEAVRPRYVILLGVHDGMVRQLQMAIKVIGAQAELVLNEEEAYNAAQKLNPEKIFCQFLEDEKILDAKALRERFSQTPSLSKIPFYVFCEEGLVAAEAMKSFPEDQILSFAESNELLRKMRAIFKRKTPA